MSKQPLALQCDGACEHHEGDVRTVLVRGWGNFNYCQAAIDEDRRRGLWVIDEKEVINKAESV
jgi:CO dehydrogenase/acetyl-CoA synthase beta subunit